MSNKRGIPTLSLFSGAGGLDVGFHKAGFDIRGCVEIEPAYAATLRANIGADRFFGPDAKVHCQDIADFDVSEYVGAGIECVIGGPPCQTFSAAGRRSGGVVGTSDARGRLFERFCEVLEVLKPKAFVFENVYGLPGANGGGPWRAINSAFSDLGYVLRAEVVDAADYGVPQHRERLILVGTLQGRFEFPLPTHGPDAPSGVPLVPVEEAIAELQDPEEPVNEEGLGGMYGHLLPLVPEGLNYAFFTAEMGHPEPVFAWRSKFHDLLYKVDRAAPCRTIKAQPGKFTGPFHWKNRHFTTPELKRLQSFPDEYELVGRQSKVIEQIGNSVPPRLAEVIATSLREQIYEDRSELTFPIRQKDFQSTFRQRQRERSKHFKSVAEDAIRRQYGTGREQGQLQPFDEAYTLACRSFFEREKIHGSAAGAHPYRYDVVVKDKGDNVLVDFARSDETASPGWITIDGLEKYLGRIRSVDISCRLADFRDVFFLWVVIEDVLVSRSRFFTLIDIYGHYANRGDAVKVNGDYGFSHYEPISRALNYFLSSEHCGGFFSRSFLRAELQVNDEHLSDVVKKLRGERFDIRTDVTHPIIGVDRVLVTYPFPLLSQKALVESKVQFLSDFETAVG